MNNNDAMLSECSKFIKSVTQKSLDAATDAMPPLSGVTVEKLRDDFSAAILKASIAEISASKHHAGK